MERLGIVVVALIFVFLPSIHGIELVQLKDITRVNKIHYDDKYDCVDFYKQPAFDHPLLANHTFHHEMRPSTISKMTRTKTNLFVNHMEVRYKGKGCPVGTVPIRRITEKDRIREKSLVKYRSNYNVQDAMNPGTHYAVVRTKMNPTKRYNGGYAALSIWNPSVQSSQISTGQIVVHNGNDNIQVGWTVNPTLYGDNRTTQCFNTHCPGFVVTNKNYPVDDVFDYVSKRGGPTTFVQLMISKEGKDGHWWLRVGEHLEAVGFWPKNIFTGLANMATSVEWGGQVHSSPNLSSPPMGSREFLKDDTYYDAYCKWVKIVDEAHHIIDAKEIETVCDTPRYQVKFRENVKHFGSLVKFGVPGGVTGN